MIPVRDVIADNLPTFAETWKDYKPVTVPTRHQLNDAAERILRALREEGYVIIRDRSDHEGGIPGRMRVT